MILLQYDSDNLPYEKVRKNEPVCIADEVPFDIPESWEWVRWATLSESIQYGYNAPAQENGRIKMVRISDIQDNSVLWETVPYCDIRESEIDAYLLKPNDILFARTGGTVGKSYLVQEVPEEAIYAGYLIRTRYSNQLCPQYLKYFMESELYWSQLREGTIATAQPNCNGKTLGNMLVPIPPLLEQFRIVEKLNKIMLCVNEYSIAYSKAKQLNDNFPEQLKKSILQEAIQGKLVPQNPADEPASVLLEHICAEKQKLIAEGKLKKDKHESVIFRRDNSHYEKLDGVERCIDDEIPFEIPDNWCWTRLGTMIGVQRGASPRPKGSPEYWSSERTPHHWIKISDITKYTQNDVLYDTDEFLTDLGTTKSVFVDSDYLITAASGSLGKIAKLNISGYIYDGLMCMCFKNTSLEMDYIIILIQAMVEYLMSLSTGTAWKNITTDILKNLLVPLPPLSEQRYIVEKQQELFDKITLIQRGIV